MHRLSRLEGKVACWAFGSHGSEHGNGEAGAGGRHQRCLPRGARLASAEPLISGWMLAGLSVLWTTGTPPPLECRSRARTGEHLGELAVWASGLVDWCPPLARRSLNVETAQSSPASQGAGRRGSRCSRLPLPSLGAGGCSAHPPTGRENAVERS